MSRLFRSKYLWLLGLLILVPLLAYTGLGLASLYKAPQIGDLRPTPTNENTSSTTATGDGFDDFGSCDEDARNYCSGFYSDDWQSFATENGYTSASWKLGLVDCLEQNQDLTSQACDDSLDRRAALNEDLIAACEEDRAMYCKGVKPVPGSEPMVDCLKTNYENLSETCVEALDAHEAAKPTDTAGE